MPATEDDGSNTLPDGSAGLAQARVISRVVGPLHNISYYAPEMKAFADHGIHGYWRAYMAYRSAPMGPVPASVVASTFYNFAPRAVEAAIPDVWQVMSPAAAMALRDECIDQALRRSLGELVDSPQLAEGVELMCDGLQGLGGEARPLFAAHAELDWPQEPHMALWHGATLWREYRGDGHNIALAAAEIDGVECHLLVAARNPGSGMAETIQQIRGWTSVEWESAVDRLVNRGLIAEDGSFTTQGRDLRRELELSTDRLAAAPCATLGVDGVQRLYEILDPIVAHLVSTGAVAGSWPPDASKTPPRA